MENIELYSYSIIDRNGKKQKYFRPWFGRLEYCFDGNKCIITKTNVFGWKKVTVPSMEDRLDMNIRYRRNRK